MREVDRLTTERDGVHSLQLMEAAGKHVADAVRAKLAMFRPRRVAVLCGKGNNGGDGFVAARLLKEARIEPFVCLFGAADAVHGDAAANLDLWLKASGEITQITDSASLEAVWPRIAEAHAVVDALLGTGLRGPASGVIAEAIVKLNQLSRNATLARPATILAVDIPSGLPSDGQPADGPVLFAHRTVTFTAPKVGMVLRDGPRQVGQIAVREIGSPPEIVEQVGKGRLRWSEPREFLQFASPRQAEGNKGDYGHALIVAGAVGKTGAAVLASWAALRVGAGLVTVAIPEPALPVVASHTPEVMTEPLPATDAGTISLRSLENGRFDAIAKGKRALGIGPGLSTYNETQEFIRAVVGKRAAPIVLDADGLNAFAGRAAELKKPDGVLALTPHPGEMARLVGGAIKEVQTRRVELALKSAADWNAFVILKGHQTVVAPPSGEAYINSTGNPGMGTGGTGDVLTGMLAGVTAQFGVNDWARLLAFGVYLHGLAGDIAYADHYEAPLMASDLIRAIPRAYHHFYFESGRG